MSDLAVFPTVMLTLRFWLCAALAARAGYVWARNRDLPAPANAGLAFRARTWAALGLLGAFTQALRIGHPPDTVAIPDVFGTLFLGCIVITGWSQLRARAS